MATIYFSIEGILSGKKKSPNKNFKFLRQKFKKWLKQENPDIFRLFNGTA